MGSSSNHQLKCPQCGQKVKADWVICPNCHRDLKDNCPYCGEIVRVGWTGCPYCGTKLPPP